ncbi:hypothetical protein GE061_013156 [Apolygus lucorum]|uniref:Uncharacterized protein n=1 Tax=Apolygus lucorum TaxID=248454 RepID=A0A6A4K1S0_APOLU|nr:hypothetical protein GE061_013156 [Apolygus lucorum]
MSTQNCRRTLRDDQKRIKNVVKNLQRKPRLRLKTLLRLLTGEIDLNDGTASIYGKVSLCTKKAWLFPRASMKQNIQSNLFYNSQKFQRVLNICNLSQDLQYLPKGENTIDEESVALEIDTKSSPH